MNRFRFASLFAGLILSTTAAVFAEEAATAQRLGIVPHGASATSFSAELPIVAKIQGTALFRTLVAIQNNSNKAITASYQFSYTCFAAACSPANGFYRTQVQTINLQALDAFVQDDFVEYLNGQGLLQPGANQGTFGTLLITFNNLPSSNGYEAGAVGRTYNRLVEADPNQGTVGFAYNASLFFDSADTTLIAFGRDTKAAPTIAGKIRTNVGVRNTDINATNQNLTVDLTFYDTKTGQKVGNAISITLRPGELQQVSDLWTAAAIPSTVNNVIIFIDVRNPTATSPTAEAYVTLIDGQNTQDAAWFPALCADVNGCGT